jgi:hypothetical protein
MNKEKYEDLILRFAKELHEVGVTEGMRKIIEAQWTRAPNIAVVLAEEDTRKFTYVHDGYEIRAVQNIKLVVKKCK